MKPLDIEELNEISGGRLDWDSGGLAVIGQGFAGGPATAVFGLAVGGAMLAVGHYALS
ncbi:bacteriocin [Salinimonas chungwhensis]|uniref:bacteriocin n=1 Tax=Salinimonas chungwhensis TaxID=265425 RepID=UPI00039AB640|nr:bacteriocin [Salinimonas chungwhensis]